MTKSLPNKKPRFQGELLDNLILEQRRNERWFVAAAYSEPGAVERYAWVSPDIFADQTARDLWAAMVASGDPFKAAYDQGLLLELTKAVRDAPNLDRTDVYAEKLLTFPDLVRLARAAQDSLGAIFQDGDADRARVALQGALEAAPTRGGDNLDADMMHLRMTEALVNGYAGVKTYIPELDRLLKVMVKGDISILASRTSLGKTALALQIARNNCFHSKKVLYISTEIRADILWLRMAAGAAQVDIGDAVAGNLSEADSEALSECSGALAQRMAGYWYCNDSARTYSGVARAARLIRPDLLIVDHLDDFIPEAGGREENRVTLLGSLFGKLRDLGNLVGAHTLAVHQLKRAVDEREDKAPQLADLRWSGDLEQKADIVLMIQRTLPANGGAPALTLFPNEVWVRKNRLGPRDVSASMIYATLSQQFYDDLNDPALMTLRQQDPSWAKPRL